MKRHGVTILAFIMATFVTQAISHFVISADHYAAIPHIRKEPIFQFGFLAMLIQGAVLSVLYARIFRAHHTIKNAVGFSWMMGAFLVSYMALAEVAKYTVPSTASWIGVEMASGFVQFTVFGILLWLVYRGAVTK